MPSTATSSCLPAATAKKGAKMVRASAGRQGGHAQECPGVCFFLRCFLFSVVAERERKRGEIVPQLLQVRVLQCGDTRHVRSRRGKLRACTSGASGHQRSGGGHIVLARAQEEEEWGARNCLGSKKMRHTSCKTFQGPPTLPGEGQRVTRDLKILIRKHNHNNKAPPVSHRRHLGR